MNSEQVKIVKILNASINKVWEAWTNPENIKQWLSPEGMKNPEVTNNLKVEGEYRIVMEGRNMPDPAHNGIMAVGGKYLEIEKPHKLVFSWVWESSPAKTHTTKVVLFLKKIDKDKTEMTLIHTDFADDNMRREHDMGWNSTFNKLEQFLKGGEEKK